MTSFGNKIQDACKGMSVQQDKSDLKVDQGNIFSSVLSKLLL